MRRSVEIAVALFRRRSARATAAVLAAAGLASGSLPLLDAPGYELGQAGALLAALLAPFAGIAAWRLERARPGASPGAAWAGASLASCGLLAVLFAGALLRAAVGPCSAAGPAALFLPLLALPSALLGAALAVAAAVLAGGRRALAAAIYAAVALLSLAASLRAAYLGPAAFVFDPLLGAFPGPIYDEALPPDLRTLLLRASALLEALAVAAATEAFVRARRAGARAAALPALALVLAAEGAAGAQSALSALGLSGEREVVQRALGGRREGPRCTLVYPSEKSAAAAAALLSECEFHHADLSRALGIASPPHVTAYVHRSADEKRRLVGAAATDFAKPWLAELHVVDSALPHPSLRHELVHAVAAGAAQGPLRVPARAMVLVSTGLVEGVAVALETPRSRWTVHEWSRAARALGFLPDVRRAVGPAGFWSEPPARAYTAAGSFLRFVLDRNGPAALREAYRTGDLVHATGEPLGKLADEWERFLDGVPLPPGLEGAARARLSRGSIFSRACAREIAALEVRAWRAGAEGRTAEACAIFREAAARTGSPSDLKAVGDLLLRRGELDGAEAAYREAEQAASPEDTALHAAVTAARGDVAWLRGGEIAPAVAAWGAALATAPDRAEARLLHAKITAASDRALGPAVRDLLAGVGDPTLALAKAARADHPLAAYLVGRALAARGEAAAAAPELARAVNGSLPAPIADEAALLLGSARCASGDVAAGEAVLARLLETAPSEADRERIGEALRRCAFEAGRGR
jgi:tetratricopeptide (TPR) repeat protein